MDSTHPLQIEENFSSSSPAPVSRNFSPSPPPFNFPPTKTNFWALLNMSVNNPYAAAGWANPQNPWSVNDPRGQSFAVVPPSIYGALPFAAPRQAVRLLDFQFSALNPDILNCIVLGPNARHCFSITTSSPSHQGPSVTLIRNSDNAVVGKIEWHARPVVEVQNMIPRTLASQLIPLSQDMTYRTMVVKGKPYAWMTHNGMIRLYNTAYNPSELMGCLAREQNAISLSVAADVIHHGMLEVSVLIAILFYSGRNID